MLTKKDFKLLKDQDFYFLMATIRGPDRGGYALKHVFTARIRHLLNPVYTGIDKRSEKTVSSGMLFDAFSEALLMDHYAFNHYASHIYNALDVMKNNKLITIKESTFLMTTLTNISTLMDEITSHHGDKPRINIKTAINKHLKDIMTTYPKFTA